MNCKVCLNILEEKKPTEFVGYHDACIKNLFRKSNVSPFLEFDKKQFGSEIAQKFTKKMSISGIQQKLSMKIDGNKIVPTEIGGTYILKPTPPEYDEISQNEHVSMLIGECLGIETPPCGLVSFSNGELAYIVKRFDRDDGKKIHQEDLAQILGRQKDMQGQYKYTGSYEEVGKAIQEAAGGKQAVALRFLERLIYNFIIRNGDYHLKNISLRGSDSNNKFEKLTPNYDSLNTNLHIPEGTFFALEDFFADGYFTDKFNQYGFPTKYDFDEMAKRLEIPTKALEPFFDKLEKKKSEILNLIQASFLGEKNKAKYISGLEDRYRMIFKEKV